MAPNPYIPKNILFLSRTRIQHPTTPPPPYVQHAPPTQHPPTQYQHLDTASNLTRGNMSNFGGHGHQGGNPNFSLQQQQALQQQQQQTRQVAAQTQHQYMPQQQQGIPGVVPPSLQGPPTFQHHQPMARNAASVTQNPGFGPGLGLGIGPNRPGLVNHNPPGYMPGFPPSHLNAGGFNVNVTTQDDSDDDEEESPPFSEISIKINTPLLITGDSNLVAVDPSSTANRVAMGVISALKSISVSDGGIPMIDEEGRPRPIKIDVTCDTTLQGSNNVVGEKAFLQGITPHIKEALVNRFGTEAQEDDESRKRDREGSVSDESDSNKRARVE